MHMKKIICLLLCGLTCLSSLIVAKAGDTETPEIGIDDETLFDIYLIDWFGDQSEPIQLVAENKAAEHVAGAERNESTRTLTLENFSMPDYELSIGSDNHAEWINIELKGENSLCVFTSLENVRIKGDGSLSLWQMMNNNFEMLSGTLNFSTDHYKYDNGTEGMGLAIRSKQWWNEEQGNISTTCRFLGGKVNISGNYSAGIDTSLGDLEIANTRMNINIPKFGKTGIACGAAFEDGHYESGNLRISKSDITIIVNEDEGIPLAFGSFKDVDGNLNFYTGRNKCENGVDFDKAFRYNTYVTAKRWERSTADFPGQNYLRITPEWMFGDVADDSRYFYEPVYWAYFHKPVQITTGTSHTQFSPDKNVTRGQMVTFLYRLAGEPEPEDAKTFDDVDPSRYYAKAISWAASEGITTGYYGTNNFGPDDNCTREQIVTFLWRFAETPAPVKSASFTDAKAGAYYLDALSWAAENGITVGLNDGTGRFGVGHTCTRGMCVTFLYRYNEL